MTNFLSSKKWHLLLIVLFGLAAYSNSFHAGFNFDDLDNIKLDSVINSFSSEGFRSFFHSRRGVAYFSFFLNYQIGGMNVTGYHIINLAIHIANALLAYTIVFITVQYYQRKHQHHQEEWLGYEPAVVALWPAMLFVVHPVQTQAVTYLVQRMTSLCTLFYLAGLLFYLLARTSDRPVRFWSCQILSLFSALLASRTKEIAFTFPLGILAFELGFFDSTLRQRLKNLLLPVVLPLLLTLLMLLQIVTSGGWKSLESFTKVQTSISRIDYLLTQFRVLITYIRLIFLPVNQSIDYDYPVFTSFNAEIAISAAVLFMIMLCGALLQVRSRKQPGTPQSLFLRMIAFGIFWFFITLSIESSFIPIVDVIFEHRLYLPSFGALSTIAAFIMLGAAKVGASRRSLAYIFAPIVLVLAFATYQRNKAWADELTLWQDAYKKAPKKARVANNYAAALTLRGKGETAIPLLISSIETEPGYFAPYNNLPRAYAQLPYLKGHYRSGFEYLQPDGEVSPVYVQKWYSNALNNLGVAYLLQNNIPKAFDSYKRAAELDPENNLPKNNVMNMISLMPDRVKAASYLDQVQKWPKP